jgi:hypothetical protein
MPRKTPPGRDALDLGQTALPDPRSRPIFGTGDVAEILGLEIWRVQKFLDSPRYQLSSKHLGQGRVSRRFFSREDVYRIGMADCLVKDGFVPRIVAQLVQRFDDTDLLSWDETGYRVRPGFVALSRTEGKRKIEDFSREHPPGMSLGGSIYYVLDVGKLTEEIDRRIEEWTTKKRTS